MDMILRVARTQTADGDKDAKRGEWNLFIRKSRPTRWDFSLRNPMGGSGGMTSYKNPKAAIAAAIGRGVVDAMGKDRVWVIEQIWDYDAGHDGDYVTQKTYWLPLTESSRTAAAFKFKPNMIIVNKDHPEWGTWRVLKEDQEGVWGVRGDRGEKAVFEGEMNEWREATDDEKSGKKPKKRK